MAKCRFVIIADQNGAVIINMHLATGTLKNVCRKQVEKPIQVDAVKQMQHFNISIYHHELWLAFHLK